MSFDTDKATCFEIPLTNVSHCTSAKNEVTLEFHQNDDAPVSLMEMRFHIPPQLEGPTEDPVQSFMEAVMNKASIIQATGESIATFQELQCLTPRGRYDIKIFPTFVQLHGKTFDFKIPLSTILRVFRLPHKDNRQIFFVLSLDPPIKQGQTRYHFLILLFNNEDETKITLGMTKDEISEKYQGKLEKEMSGSTVDVLGELIKVLVQRRITLPAILAPNKSITCNYKAAAGFLYPLERGFIFIHKPALHIRFEEIAAINFARSGGSTRSFDFEVETKSGVVHTFCSIEKEEYSKLYDFVSSKNLRVKNRGTEKIQANEPEDDLVDSDLEGEPDAYLHRVKTEGKMRVQGDDGEDESDDDDFNPGEESDVGEEFNSDSNYTSSGSDDEEGSEGEKSKKNKSSKPIKEKKQKQNKTSKPRSLKSAKSKDENRPKRPMTAYFLWLNENRNKLKEEYPSLSLTELTKKAGELWKEEIKDKSKWEAEAFRLKRKYDEDMAAYKASGGGEITTSSKKSKPTKKSNVSSPAKSSSSSAFKSREYIEEDSSDSSSSSGSDSDKKKKPKKSGHDSKSNKDVEMKNASESDEEKDSEESDASEDDSD